jgi:putative transposase
MSDALWDERCFRTFSLVDDFNREALAIEIDPNLPAPRVNRVLDRVVAWRGYPAKLRLDNDSEFVAAALADWAQAHCVQLAFIQPGKPMQNGFIERFNGSNRRGVLDLYVLRILTEVRERTEAWLNDYNTRIPHESLRDLAPTENRIHHSPETSSYPLH